MDPSDCVFSHCISVVLSSDDEDGEKVQPGVQCTTLTPETKRLHLGSKLLPTDNCKREAETQSAKRVTENVKPYVIGQVSIIRLSRNPLISF